jgi:hypothetical protein
MVTILELEYAAIIYVQKYEYFHEYDSDIFLRYLEQVFLSNFKCYLMIFGWGAEKMLPVLTRFRNRHISNPLKIRKVF